MVSEYQKWVYCTEPAQLPLAQGDCLIHATARTSVVNSRHTRSGVQNSARPVTACRPHGPPIASLACAVTGSAQLGTTRSGRAEGSPDPADATDPSARRPEGAVAVSSVWGRVTASVCRARSAGRLPPPGSVAALSARGRATVAGERDPAGRRGTAARRRVA